MRNFVATIFDAGGQESVRKIRGITLEAVRQHLHEQGYTIKSIQEEENAGLWKKLQDIEMGSRIKAHNRIRFLKTLGQMINRGYVLESVLDFLLADEKEKDVTKLLQILQKKAQKGYKDYVE